MKQTLIRQLRALDDFFFDRVGPIRVLFVVRNNLGLGTLRPVIEEIILRGGYRLSVTVEFEGCIDRALLSKEAWFRGCYISPEQAIWKKWHYVFTSDYSYLYFRRNEVQVLLSHGTCFGNSDVSTRARHEKKDHHQGFLDGSRPILICANSKSTYEFFCRLSSSVSQSSSKQFVVTGRPVTDRYFNADKIKRRPFLEQHSLNPDQKTIVVGSHFNEKSLFCILGLAFIEMLCEQNSDCNVIFTGHGRLWETIDGDDNNVAAYDALKALDKENPNFKFLPKLPDAQPLISSGDLFIIDNSSFFIECCIADKPILFFDHPEFVFGEQNVGVLYKKAAFCFSTLAELPEAVGVALDNTGSHTAEREKVVDFFLANQGHATQFVVDLIESVGRVSRPGTSQWQRLEKVCQKLLHDC